MIKQAKQQHNNYYINKATNKPKATWNLVNKMKNSPDSNVFELEVLRKNSQPDIDVLNNLNHFFSTSGVSDTHNLSSTVKGLHQKSLFFRPVDEYDIREIINKMKNTYSTGMDEIPIVYIKYMSFILIPPLVHIINLCLLNGVYPEEFKLAIIKPIYKKKGERTSKENYRPIALLSVLSKILERVIANQLIHYFEKEHLIAHNHHGYIKGKNTESAIIQILDKIIKKLNNKEKVAAVHIDLSKAFDNLNHALLLDKLSSYGVRGLALKLISSYLSGRRQRVAAADDSGNLIFSDQIILTKGVPQGSILGPILFLLHMNDVPLSVESEISLYADDTTLAVSATSNDELRMKIEEDLSRLSRWFNMNGMEINKSKTQLVQYSLTQIDTLSIKVDDISVTNQATTNFLGVITDQHLTWKSHIDNLAKKISSYSYLLRTLRNEISIRVAINAYYAYIQSILSHGIIFWGNSSSITRVLKLQKTCLRRIFGLKRSVSCRDYFKKTKIPTVVELYISQCVIYVHKNRDGLKDKSTHNYTTRGSQAYVNPPRVQSSKLESQYLSQAIKLYNHLPSEIKQYSNRRFKNKIKQIYGSAFYSIDDFYRFNQTF